MPARELHLDLPLNHVPALVPALCGLEPLDHPFGWSGEQAMDYLRTRAALAEHEITTEVERYIAWPGRALAYKLGEIQIKRHRREAEEKLGRAFDQRKFHDAILPLGSVPLPVLEQRMAKFIADGLGTIRR